MRGANDRTRTGDLSLTRGLLYQLSYVGVVLALFSRRIVTNGP